MAYAAPRYTRDLRTIRFLLRTIQFYDGHTIDQCELIRALNLVRMRSEETKDEADRPKLRTDQAGSQLKGKNLKTI